MANHGIIHHGMEQNIFRLTQGSPEIPWKLYEIHAISQITLVWQLGLDKSTISFMENKTQNPQQDTRGQISL